MARTRNEKAKETNPPGAGMMFLQLYGRNGIFGPLIKKFGFNIVFAFPGAAGGPEVFCASTWGLQSGRAVAVPAPATPGLPSRWWPEEVPHALLPSCRPRGRTLMPCAIPPPLPPAPCRPRAGMALATMFVTLPFVVRELLPLLADIDPGEDEAANTLGANWLKTFFRVTLPNIKWGLLHGVLLMNAVGGWTGVGCLSGTDLGHHGPGPCAGAAGRRGSPGHPADWLAAPVPCAAWMAGLARARAARLDPPTLSAPFPSEQWGSLGQSASSRGIS